MVMSHLRGDWWASDLTCEAMIDVLSSNYSLITIVVSFSNISV